MPGLSGHAQRLAPEVMPRRPTRLGCQRGVKVVACRAQEDSAEETASSNQKARKAKKRREKIRTANGIGWRESVCVDPKRDGVLTSVHWVIKNQTRCLNYFYLRVGLGQQQGAAPVVHALRACKMHSLKVMPRIPYRIGYDVK